MKHQRQLSIPLPKLTHAQKIAIIRAALRDYPLRQAARESKRRRRRTPKPKRRAGRQLILPFYSRPGWLEITESREP